MVNEGRTKGAEGWGGLVDGWGEGGTKLVILVKDKVMIWKIC